MDDEMRMLNDVMAVKERLRVLAELQASYLEDLLARGLEQSTAEQLMMDWSRHAYGMTFHELPAPSIDQELFELLGPSMDDVVSAGPSGTPSPDDPSRVPPGEPWLQLVQDVEEDDERDERDAA